VGGENSFSKIFLKKKIKQ
jgi:hypothetical protein